MFTGIVMDSRDVVAIKDRENLRTVTVDLVKDLVKDLERGASVAINGVCLTATEIDHEAGTSEFDIMVETLRLTTLGELEVGGKVHVERSARYGDEIGGHHLSGHVQERAEVVSVSRPDENNFELRLKVSEDAIDYIFSKGFIALDGASLTVVDVDREERTFSVWLIPETLRITRFGEKQPGDFINVELDPQTVAIVETVERVMKARLDA